MGRFNLHKIMRNGDAVMEGGLESDAVILVMGPSGSGKSTFLRNVLEELPSYPSSNPKPEVSNGFNSCTRNLAAYIAPIPAKFKTPNSQRLVLVDTPGFDDTEVSDSEILRRISVWLASSYHSKMKVAGVLYLFPIFPNRITRNDKANLKVFHQLCGDGALDKVRMVTTKWALSPRTKEGEFAVAMQRESELESEFWKEMIDGGSQLSRLDEDCDSALRLFFQVLETSRKCDERQEHALALQEEIVEKKRSVPGTFAGRELKRKLQQLLREHKEASGGSTSSQGKRKHIASQLGELRVPFGERLKACFGR